MTSNGITVGIPAYNARKTLDRALDSALSQTVRAPYEIIVVDDGSTDTTANIGLSYSLMFPDVVRFIRTKNRGVAAARNTIVREARYDHLTWLDADDYYFPEKLEIQYETLLLQYLINRTYSSDPNIIVFSSFLMGKDTYAFGEYFREPEKEILSGHFRAYLWASMVATEAYRDTGEFNESLHRSEDTDWLLRYLQLEKRLLIDTGEQPVMAYNFSTDRDGKKVEQSLDHMLGHYGNLMKSHGIYTEYVPRRYWEISNFYYTNKAWDDMWRCRALAAKYDSTRYGRRLLQEIDGITDEKHRQDIMKKVKSFQETAILM
jgi:glycosyltransferase involved in cell wall biosynthesis